MTGTSSQRKGSDWERLLVQRFKAAMPGANVLRGFQSRSGKEQADVELPAFWLEAKRHRRTNLREALRQAIACCVPGKWPLAVCKDDHEPAVVVMRLDDFLELISQWWKGKAQP